MSVHQKVSLDLQTHVFWVFCKTLRKNDLEKEVAIKAFRTPIFVTSPVELGFLMIPLYQHAGRQLVKHEFVVQGDYSS